EVVQGLSTAADDTNTREIVGGLEPGGHHDDVDRALRTVGVDESGGRYRGHRAGDQLDVVLLERGVEGAGEDGPLAGIRIRRCDGGAQVRPVGELAVDVVEAELPARLVDLRTGPVEMPAPQAAFQEVALPPPLPPAPPRL